VGFVVGGVDGLLVGVVDGLNVGDRVCEYANNSNELMLNACPGSLPPKYNFKPRLVVNDTN
jgi:hypothetical protein